jgi:hypothetical protein
VSTVLKELLTELAEEAKPYDVRAKALRAGKRRRLARRATPGLVALAVLASVGLIALRPTPAPTEYQPALPPPIALPGYLAQITPQPDAPWLPTDRALGRGALVYFDRTQGYFLVTVDGAQYRLGKPPEPYASTYTLSPDGRWLVEAEHQGKSQTWLRDLTSTISIEFDRYFTLVAWSPDGRWMVQGMYGAGDPGRVRLFDLHAPVVDLNGLEVDLHGFPQTQVASVMADGRLVLAQLGTYAFPDLTIVDPHTLEQHRITVDITGHTSDEERLSLAETAAVNALVGLPQSLTFTTDGRVLLQLTRPESPPGERINRVGSSDVLVINLDRSAVTERWTLPARRPIPNSPHGDWESWRAIRMLPEGLLLAHETTQKLLSWELFQPETGEVFLVTDLTRLPSAKQ